MEITRELALKLYSDMLLARRYEEKVFQLFAQGIVPGTMHQCNGEEATNVGITNNVADGDYMTFTHRCHGVLLSRGADPKRVLAEMFGKKTGLCHGMGGAIHYADASLGMLGTNGIVGASIPQAVGAAWTCQYKKTNGVAFSIFGDGSSNQGTFHESINLAATWKLPVVFICVNNRYAFSANYHRTTSIENIADRCAAYGIPGYIMDGMDVEDVYKKVHDAVEYVRAGNGPVLMESKTYRYMGHSRFEQGLYRVPGELQEMKKRDPIPNYAETLRTRYNYTDADLEEVEKKVAATIEEAVAYAMSSPDPEPDEYLQYVYAK